MAQCKSCEALTQERDLLLTDLQNAEKDLRKQRRSAQALKREYAKLMQTHPESAEVQKVLEHWRDTISPKAKIPPDGIRARKVLARLADTFTADQLCRAVDACAQSDWHMGKDKKTQGRSYNDLELICRNEAQVEKFLGMYAHTETPDIGSLLVKLHNIKYLPSGHDWEADCPVHEGPGLYVTRRPNGNIGVVCAKGCRRQKIWARLDEGKRDG